MTKKDLETIRTIVAEAVENTVPQTVKEVVNGKIDRLNDKLDSHLEQHEEQWKNMQPVLETFNNYSGFRKVVISWGIIIGGVIGAGAGLTEIISLFKR